MKDIQSRLDALTALLYMCEVHGDFSNGVTDSTGTIDEGNVRSSEVIRSAWDALALLKADADIVRNLLWDEHPECCGCPVVGATYMGDQEMVCCGQPEPALLNDKQIVATLRAKFPEQNRAD